MAFICKPRLLSKIERSFDRSKVFPKRPAVIGWDRRFANKRKIIQEQNCEGGVISTFNADDKNVENVSKQWPETIDGLMKRITRIVRKRAEEVKKALVGTIDLVLVRESHKSGFNTTILETLPYGYSSAVRSENPVLKEMIVNSRKPFFNMLP